MNGTLFGLIRRDRDRPSLRPDDLPALFGGDASTVLHADDDLLLMAAVDRAPAVAVDGGDVLTALGDVSDILEPGFEDVDPGDPYALLRLWRARGVATSSRLDGHHALVVKSGGATSLVQDRMCGIVNLHWCEREGVVAFADRIRPLLAWAPELRRADPAAVQEYLGRSYICAPRTAFAGVRRLPSGTMLVVGPAGVKTLEHDPWRRTDDAPRDEAEALPAYRELLCKAIGGWLGRDPDCGFLLSGGLDSSVNVALGSERADRPLRTFGVAAEKFHTDAPYARRVAEQYGCEHVEKTVSGSEIEDLPRLAWHLENLFFEPGVMLTWCALNATAPHVRTVVGGETADQLFGACAAPASGRLAARRRLGPLFGLGRAALRTICRSPWTYDRSFFRKVENKLVGEYEVENWCGRYGFRECDLAGLMRGPLRGTGLYDDTPVPDGDRDALFDFGCVTLNRDYALEGILIANGRIGDALGLTTFSPFLARPVADFILGLPWDLRTLAVPDAPGDFVYKRLHRLLAYECLERDVVDRPKQGGAINTLIHFQDPEWCALVKRALAASSAIADLCRPEVVATLFDDVKREATRIMMLVTYDLWHHLHLEDRPFAEPEFGLTDFLRMRAGERRSP